MFSTEDLRRDGFSGFARVLDPKLPARVPRAPGVYAVVASASRPRFVQRSVGGHFKGNDPTVPVSALLAKWVEGSETLYLGRANNLSGRLALLARFGRGEPVRHWGGRYLWQLEDAAELIVAWRVDDDPVGAEGELIDRFVDAHGQLPFANLIRGRRSALAL